MLGHDIWSALPRLRAQAESTLRDTANIQSRTIGTVDSVTGERVDTWTTYATVRCRIRTTLGESVMPAGGEQITAQRMTAAIPVSQAGVEVGHRLVVTASIDPTMVGRAFYVRALPRATDLVLRRLTVTDVQE